MSNEKLWQNPEGQAYLDHFKCLEPQQFAVIKVGGELIDDDKQLKPLAEDLATLWQLGLCPVVVHGGGPQINAALKEEKIETSKVNGRRVTSPEAAALIPEVLAEVNSKLVSAIYMADAATSITPAVGIESGVFRGTLTNPNDLGSVKQIAVKTGLVNEIINEASFIPVISCTGSLAVAGANKQPININGDKAAVAMAGALAVDKFISLTSIGAVLDHHGNPINELTQSLADELIAEGVINGGMAMKVKQAMKLFDYTVHDIVITSPLALLKELFTDKGAGTIIHAQQLAQSHSKMIEREAQ